MEEKKEDASGWDINKMKTAESKKVEETEVVPPILEVSEDVAVESLSSHEISDLIVKKKHRLFDRKKPAKSYTLEELQILQEQKLKEERLARESAADEETLAAMKLEKKGYYEHYRKFFSMGQSQEVRLKKFFEFYTARVHSPGALSLKNSMERVQSWMDLFGISLADKKSKPFSDAEFEAFAERCKASGIECPFDVFAKTVRERTSIHKETADADKHRLELYEQVLGGRK